MSNHYLTKLGFTCSWDKKNRHLYRAHRSEQKTRFCQLLLCLSEGVVWYLCFELVVYFLSAGNTGIIGHQEDQFHSCIVIAATLPWSQRLSFNIIFFHLEIWAAKRWSKRRAWRKRKPLVATVENLTFMLAQHLIGSITSRCSGKEPALLPRTQERVDQTRENGGNRA